jgi:hypothetical protein
MKAHPRVAWQLLDGKAVLLDLDRNVAMGLNPSATFLWSRLEGRDAAALAADLAAEYGLEGQGALADVERFLALLRERGLVEE